MSYARIEDILPDHKPGWFHVKLMLLQIPLQVVTWILREEYIEGAEYTMGGKKMRIEKVVCPEDVEGIDAPAPEEEKSGNGDRGNVISLADLKKE